jgi:hypothetical protein
MFLLSKHLDLPRVDYHLEHIKYGDRNHHYKKQPQIVIMQSNSKSLFNFQGAIRDLIPTKTLIKTQNNHI